MTSRKVLLMTVGVGDAANLEGTLFAPLRKSMGKGEWARVVLLPSLVSRSRAEEMVEAVRGLPIEIRPLPRERMEDDADSCFAHFDSVLAGLAEEGIRAADIVADFTRGTKAMTAAITLAAAGRGVKALRYVTGRRDTRGTVEAGTEEIYDFRADRVTFRHDLDIATRLLDTWQFRSAGRLVDKSETEREIHPEQWLNEARWISWLAEFWGAWDRFDYVEGCQLLNQRPAGSVPARLGELDPDHARQEFVRRLAEDLPQDPKGRANPVRDLTADTIENGRRRLQLGELEDAMLRAYRVLEFLGQIRLFVHGQDSEGVDLEWAPAAKWKEYQEGKKKRVDVENGKLKLARLKVASLLKHMGDPFGKVLCSKKFDGLDPVVRNRSILVHGYRAGVRTEMAESLRKTYDELEELFLKEDPDNKERLETARFPLRVQE